MRFVEVPTDAPVTYGTAYLPKETPVGVLVTVTVEVVFEGHKYQLIQDEDQDTTDWNYWMDMKTGEIVSLSFIFPLKAKEGEPP